jgi:hypothetical protein
MPNVKYFKRHRMELPLQYAIPATELPPGFSWLSWEDSLLNLHAEVKFASFQNEPDSLIFPCLSTRNGCRDLMEAIRYRPGFCPQATWLIMGPDCAVGTIQGLLDENRFGGIQNLGVLPEYRGLGLGRALLLRALAGFASMHVRRAFLEVTATNSPAVRMYRKIGFRAHKTLYRAVEIPEAEIAGVGL